VNVEGLACYVLGASQVCVQVIFTDEHSECRSGMLVALVWGCTGIPRRKRGGGGDSYQGRQGRGFNDARVAASRSGHWLRQLEHGTNPSD
jgi:hypothetical protein